MSSPAWFNFSAQSAALESIPTPPSPVPRSHLCHMLLQNSH